MPTKVAAKAKALRHEGDALGAAADATDASAAAGVKTSSKTAKSAGKKRKNVDSDEDAGGAVIDTAADDDPPLAKRTRSNSITSVDMNTGVVDGAAEAEAAAEAEKQKRKVKKAKKEDKAAEEPAAAAVDDSLALHNFRLSAETVALLKQRGIEKLFPIQAQTFEAILDGRDVVGQAKTGSGKTLSFALPVVERMAQTLERKRGRPPTAIVMAPTRELAMQIEREIAFLCQGRNIATTCIYGGAPYEPQESALRQGVDVVIGTPGRIMDHIERGRLVLSGIKFVVLDEADRMLEVTN